MAYFALLTVALLAGSAYASPYHRIIGGESTTILEHPSIVQVDHYYSGFRAWIQTCAANILNSRYVLSAANCFSGELYQAQDRRIRAGATVRNTGGVLAYVEEEFNHPSFGVLGEDGDISVVRLSTALVLRPGVEQGLFVGAGVTMPDNLPVLHAGWGQTQESGSSSYVLLETTIYTINNALCAARYMSLSPPQIVTENMICAGLLDEGGKGACQGDAGGPLYYNDDSKGNIIVGIYSWGVGCANGTFPGVSTAVSPYIDWVIATAV